MKLDIYEIQGQIKKYIINVFKSVGRELSEKEFNIEINKPSDHKLVSKKEYEKNGYMYIYSYWCDGCERPLKVGKAGPLSFARYANHHYNYKSSKSCLANSLLEEAGRTTLKEWGVLSDIVNLEANENNEDEKTLHQRIRVKLKDAIVNNCYRIDVPIKYDKDNISGLDIFALELVEAALHYIYKPKFEGFENQR